MKRANEASERAKERAREKKREWKYTCVYVWERWKGEKSSDNFCTTVLRAGASRLTLLPNFCDWLYTLRSDITSVKSGPRGRKILRNKDKVLTLIIFYFAQPFDFCTSILPRRRKAQIFPPRKRSKIGGSSFLLRDPRFDSRCDLCRSSLRDNNYLKAVHTLPTLRRGDRSDAGHNICRERRLVILKPKITVSSRKREREQARKARTRRRETKSIYIYTYKRSKFFFFSHSVIAREGWIRGEKELFT